MVGPDAGVTILLSASDPANTTTLGSGGGSLDQSGCAFKRRRAQRNCEYDSLPSTGDKVFLNDYFNCQGSITRFKIELASKWIVEKNLHK